VESTLLAGGKSKKEGNLGDSARGQADPRSVAVYTMDRPGRVICMYVCVGTVFHPLGPTDPLRRGKSILVWFHKFVYSCIQLYTAVRARRARAANGPICMHA
jgi:hypothetical protein